MILIANIKYTKKKTIFACFESHLQRKEYKV